MKKLIDVVETALSIIEEAAEVKSMDLEGYTDNASYNGKLYRCGKVIRLDLKKIE